LSTAEKLGERKIIEILWKHLDKALNMQVPFGDDVSAIKLEDDNLAVLKTDMLVGKTDVPPRMSYWQAARKAVVMNISDLAAKGVKPLGLIVSLGIPRNLTTKDIEQIGKGLNAGAREYDTHVLGGDTNETEDLVISVGAFGLVKKENLVLRSGARPKDIVATTGLFGLTSSGLKILTEKLTAPPKIRKKLLDAILKPQARLQEGLALARTGAVTASIDSSDGLAWSLHEISRASNVGFLIDALPVAPEAYEFAKMHNLDPLELGFYGGEEYELIVTINSKYWKKVKETIVQQGSDLFKIGRATAEKEILFKKGDEVVKVEARGYEHFQT
jgi:thiamine-monophosphate kinase